MIDNKIAYKITKKLPQNNLENDSQTEEKSKEMRIYIILYYIYICILYIHLYIIILFIHLFIDDLMIT